MVSYFSLNVVRNFILRWYPRHKDHFNKHSLYFSNILLKKLQWIGGPPCFNEIELKWAYQDKFRLVNWVGRDFVCVCVEAIEVFGVVYSSWTFYFPSSWSPWVTSFKLRSFWITYGISHESGTVGVGSSSLF